MTIEEGSANEARAYLDILAKFDSEDARCAFVFLHLSFSRFCGCRAVVGEHGVMRSMRILDNGDWSYAFASARNWVKAWIRPPEFRRGRISLSDLSAVLPHATDRGDNHLVVSLHDFDEACSFHALVEASRKI
jgi:hypothetical protein